MTKNELRNRYFNWMCQLVCDNKYYKKTSYKRLLSYLYNRDFVYIIDMDGNRAEDGVDLRYRFSYEFKYPQPMVASFLDNKPCSILEMMIALAFRCEEHIMNNPAIGDRTGHWFWNMMDNLGIDRMTDSNYDENSLDRIILTFLNREYGRNGEGGLFKIRRNNRDLRSVEIWHQMCWYLDDVLERRDFLI
jgi:hypothetical protein